MNPDLQPTNPHAEAPLTRRLRFTPIRDLVRGRLTGRLDLDAAVASYRLPVAIESLVRRVARSTRLDRVERVEVARDLADHFRDGLAAGGREDDLVREFGEERAAARLLRRSMLRKRPIWRRAHRRVMQAMVITVAAVSAIYLLAAARYWSQRPVITTDYIARLNAPVVAIAEADRSWPSIRAAMEDCRALVEPDPDVAPESMSDGRRRDAMINRLADAARIDSIEPWQGPDVAARERRELDEDAPDAATVATLFDRADPVLEAIRDAAARPALGREVTTGMPADPADVEFFGLEVTEPDAGSNGLADSVIAIQLPHYTTIRAAARLLAVDARRAVGEGDGGRAVTDLEAVFDLGRQVRMPSFLIGQLVGIAIEQLGFDVVLDAVATHPDAFTDADLVRLAGLLTALDDDRLRMDLAAERYFFEDLAQRFYTDDGEGNGVLTVRGAEDLGGVTQGGGLTPSGDTPSIIGFLAAPALANLTLDRRTAVAVWNDFFDRCEVAVDADPWSIDRAALATLDGRPMQETMADWRSRIRYFPLNLLVPALDRAVLTGVAIRSQRDLVATVVALERMRRLLGHWPASLEDIPTSVLPAPARDPFDGEPIRYAILDGVPTVWTIGPDRRDDGGRAVEDRRDPRAGLRRFESPAGLATLSTQWGADQPPVTDVEGDIVVWRGR